MEYTFIVEPGLSVPPIKLTSALHYLSLPNFPRTFEETTGTVGTKFDAYLSPPPTSFMHEINIYWPIMKTNMKNNEYSLYFSLLGKF